MTLAEGANVIDESSGATSLSDTRAIALSVAEILADTPASETLVLDIHELAAFADFFIVCTGDNERQVRAISEETKERMAEQGIRPMRVEGSPISGWVVLDYGDVIVHILHRDQREYYRLEQLWGSAPRLVSIQ